MDEKEWNRSNNPGLGGSEDSIYTFEPEVIALLGDTEEKAKKIKRFSYFFFLFLV